MGGPLIVLTYSPSPWLRSLSRLTRDDSAQDLIEYGLLAAFISVVSTATIIGLGLAINDFYDVRVLGQLP
jgi:Flp pilus assembly pilin Flp